MVCRASCKPAKRMEKSNSGQCNIEAIRSETTACQVNRADVRASENMERSDF